MSNMGKSVVKSISGREVICRELTVAQVRAMTLRSEEIDPLGDLLFENVRLCDLPLLTNLLKEDVESMLPSDLRVVISGCRESNPDFFTMLDRMSASRTVS